MGQYPSARGVGGEHAFLERLRARLPPAPEGQVWIGDDAAVLDGLLVTTDALVERLHFDLSWCSAGDVGWKALAVNLSDIAAMGGTPRAAVATLVVPPDRPGLADQVIDGVAAAATAFGCPLVGGDTTAGPALMVSVTVLGVCGPTGPVLRSGARPGDAVFVTGEMGGAAAALEALRDSRVVAPALARRLHRPTPRLREGQTAAAGGATAHDRRLRWAGHRPRSRVRRITCRGTRPRDGGAARARRELRTHAGRRRLRALFHRSGPESDRSSISRDPDVRRRHGSA